MTDAARALQHETDFLAGVEANFEAAKGRDLRGSIWQRSSHDESDRLRALLAENRIYDRELLNSLPANRRVALHGFERRLLLWKRRTGVAIASVLSPLRHYVTSRDTSAPPVGLGELADHVRKLIGDSRVPHLIGVCSPSGFTEEARRAKLESGNATVVLIEPDAKGGWRTTAAGDNVDPRVLKIFDPEGAKEKVERVRRMVAEHSTDLLTGGLTASAIARQAHLPEHVVRQGMQEIAKSDPELRFARKDGEFLLFRGAPVDAAEPASIGMIERIKRLLSGEGNEAAKINVLAERRAALAQRRDRIYEDITKLEDKEAELFEQGKNATSAVPRRRIAAQLAQMRKDIGRLNTTAGMLNQQINIISTDIHNLTLIQQGRMAKLPDSEELTEHAVEAEEMLETLQADAELVGNLEMGMEQAMASEEEMAILKEFEQAKLPPASAEPSGGTASVKPERAAQPPARGAVQPPSRGAAQPASREGRLAESEDFEPRAPEPPRKDRGKTGPEPG